MFSVSRTLAACVLSLALLLEGGSYGFAQAVSGVDTNQTTLPFSIGGTTYMTLNGSGLQLQSAGLYNSSGYRIVQGNASDWLRINPDTAWSKGTAAYGAWAFGSGGVAIGAWNSSIPAGGLYVSNQVMIGTTTASGALTVNGAMALTGTNAALSIGNATALTSASAQTLANLQNVGACGTASSTSASALTVTANTGGVLSFACQTVTDITGVGKTTLPTCSSTQVLTFNGSTFSCVANPTIPSCQPGYLYQGIDSSGNPTCVAVTSITPSCAPGYVYQGLNANGNQICVQSMPNCGANKIVGTDGSGNPACLNTPPDNSSGQPLYVKNTTMVTDYTVYNKYIYWGASGTTQANTAANRATMLSAQQGFYNACAITGNDDTSLNTKVASQLCEQVYCAGFFYNQPSPTMSQTTGVCNSTQATSGLPCSAPSATYPTGTMYLTMSCLYAQ